MAHSAFVAFVACLALVAGETPAAFDAPFTFPKLKHLGSKAPTEAEFSSACFSFIYETLGGKRGPPKLPVDKIEPTVMTACRQKDRTGCKNFGEQLRSIVEKKTKESPKLHEKHNHRKNGEPSTKTAKKVEDSKEDTLWKPVEHQVVEAPKPAPVAKKEGEDDYGMKVWKPKKHDEKKGSADSKLALAAHHAQALAKVTEEVMEPIAEATAKITAKAKTMSLLAPLPSHQRPSNFNPADYGLDAAEGRQTKALMGMIGESKPPMFLQTTAAVAPVSYNTWCANLYAAATATWSPTK
jgi:hypothetical protein